MTGDRRGRRYIVDETLKNYSIPEVTTLVSKNTVYVFSARTQHNISYLARQARSRFRTTRTVGAVGYSKRSLFRCCWRGGGGGGGGHGKTIDR